MLGRRLVAVRAMGMAVDAGDKDPAELYVRVVQERLARFVV